MSDPTRFIAAVVVALFRGGRVLAMRRAPDKDAGAGAWEALSGRVEPGEDPLQAALRETREECGLEPAIDPRPIASYQAKRNTDDMIVVVYRAASESGDVVLSPEHDRFSWMTLEEFTRACPFPAGRGGAASRFAGRDRPPVPRDRLLHPVPLAVTRSLDGARAVDHLPRRNRRNGPSARQRRHLRNPC